MDPTLLHFMRRYRERRGRTLVWKVKQSSQANSETCWQGKSRGKEGEMNLHSPGRTASKDNPGTKKLQAYLLMFCCMLAENNHWQSQWESNKLANHSHLRVRAEFLRYKGSVLSSSVRRGRGGENRDSETGGWRERNLLEKKLEKYLTRSGIYLQAVWNLNRSPESSTRKTDSVTPPPAAQAGLAFCNHISHLISLWCDSDLSASATDLQSWASSLNSANQLVTILFLCCLMKELCQRCWTSNIC